MATADEKLVHLTFLDGCFHPDYETESYVRHGARWLDAICVKCGERVNIRYEMLRSPWPGRGRPPALERQAHDEFEATYPPHFLDMITARAVLKGIEAKGWEWRRLVRDGEYTYAAENGTRRVEGDPSRNEVEAVRSMAVKLARSPLYRLSR